MRAAIYARILLTLCLLALAASVSAESGWYLMSPPFDDRGVIVPEAPLKKWSHVENSARECEVNQFVRTQRANEICGR